MQIPKPHELRVLNEHAELKEKIEKLQIFLHAPNARAILSKFQISLMENQLNCMQDYLHFLQLRIKDF